MELEPEKVIEYLRAANAPVTTKQMMADFGLTTDQRPDLRHLLKTLERTRRVQRLKGTAWRIAPESERIRVYTGRFSVNRKGLAFVRLDDESRARAGEGDALISKYDMMDALDGDDVTIELLRSTPMGLRGRVLEVNRRANSRIVGYYQRTERDRGEVIPRSPSIHRRISVPIPVKELGIANHEWVVAEIRQFTPAPDPLVGVVVERIGASHEKGIDVLLLLRDKGIVPEFPPDVEAEAHSLAVDWEHELSWRHDLRELVTATIDPATAKDFDDALSIENLGDKGWRLWVHIADVSHFLKPGGRIDMVGQERSTSVYPVDRVVPMLPEKLSNDLCSLRPLENKLAMTAEMHISTDGEILTSTFYSSVIRSNQRLAYEQVQAFFDEQAGAEEVVVVELREKLLLLRDCARAMRKRRFARGALDLDIPELEVVFHESGKVSHLHYAERFEAHKLVEDCMLAANEAVALHLTRKKVPLLYRIHEQADPDRLEKLVPVLRALQVPLRVSKKGVITAHDLQAALRSLEGRRAGHIIRRIVLRALKRAQYSQTNAGHFGLASPCYCHFTSPIRRYPDVVVHRQLKCLERGVELQYPNNSEGLHELERLAKYTSDREREADDAEWESSAIKSIEYLKQFEGEEFEGLISGVQPFGLFVELQPHGIEGLVPIRTLTDDRYDLDELGIALVGRRGGHAYRLTDAVQVRLVRADPFENKLDLELVEQENRPPARGRPGKGRGKKPFYRAVTKDKRRGKRR